MFLIRKGAFIDEKDVIFFSTIVFLFVLGCGSEKKEVGKKEEITISAGVNLVAGKYDPCTGYGVWAPDIFHSHLLTVKKDNKLENDLAVSQQVSDDGMVYIFKIREDVKFSDGNVLTAEDVVFTFETSMQKASAADLTMLDKVEAKDTTQWLFI